jgi:hypothetical protein
MLFRNFQAGKVCFYVFMFPEKEPVDTALVKRAKFEWASVACEKKLEQIRAVPVAWKGMPETTGQPSRK